MGLMNGLGLIAVILGFALPAAPGQEWQSLINVLIIVLGASIAAFGVRGAKMAFYGMRIGLRQRERDSNDTLASLLALCELSRRTGLQGLAAVRSNWTVMRRVCQLIAMASDETTIRHESNVRSEAVKQKYHNSAQRLRWMMVFSLIGGFGGGFLWSGEALFNVVWFLSGMSVSGLLAILAARIEYLCANEVDNVKLAFSGAISILRNNSSESVYNELSLLVPKNALRPMSELQHSH